MVGLADGYVALHLRKSRVGQDDVGARTGARHAAVLFGEDEWLTLLDAEINSLADHVRHSKRLKAALLQSRRRSAMEASSEGGPDRVGLQGAPL
jgi:hypothetical protein